MNNLQRLFRYLCVVGVASLLPAAISTSHAQTTTANVKVEILGVGAESLIGGDLTDPENDGLDELGAATDPSWNWAEITSSHESDFEGGENSFNIFDNKVGGGNDKWCCDDPTPDNPVWVAVKFKLPVRLNYFTVTSGNDSPDRDPTDWAIQGSNDGTTYTDIYRFYDTTVPWTERNQVAKFTLPASSPAYSYLRYIAYDTPGTLHQINEIEYFGSTGGASDTDNDGMPNDYETAMGFNPNDPTDAAKDFDGDGVSNLDEYKAGTNPIDTTRPTLVSAVTASTFDTITLSFSEDLDAATATAAANYTITPSLAVTSAAYKSKVVTLTTAAQTPGGTKYTVAIKGVKDTSKNEVLAGTEAVVFSYLNATAGLLEISYWTNITGTPVQNLYDDPRYPGTPDGVGAVYSFNSRHYFPTDGLENYGAVMEGYLTPTESGSYRFFVYSDDASELYLSTDDTEANVALIAQETGCCNNFTEPDSPRTSEPIALVAGKKYFVRMVYKEGGGGDYGQVAWRKEGDSTPAGSLLPIPGRYLSSASALPYPADGVWLTQTPAANAKGIAPNAAITIVHADGKTAWTAANVTLKVNDVAVTPTFSKAGNEATLTYQPTALLTSKSSQKVTLTYPDPAGQSTTREWTYEVAEYKGPTKDKLHSYPGLIFGTAGWTADKGGRTGAAGDYGMDYGSAGSINVMDASWVNTAAAKDTLSVAFWQKTTVSAASAFWFYSPKSSGTARGYQAHVPWSDGTIYFDSAGCCDADLTRINLNIDQFAGYSGDATWWNAWHHFAFVKNGSTKEIYIDGQLFHSGSGNPLPADITNLLLGGGPTISENRLKGTQDDFAVYGVGLTAAQVASLAGGAAPSTVSGLIAHWDFNDVQVPVADVKLTVTRSGSNVTITSEPATLPTGWVLQTASSVAGPWTTQAGGTTPVTVPIGTGNSFLRAAKP